MDTKLEEKAKIRFKTYEQNVPIHLPVLVGDLVKHNSQVQLINKIIERLALSALESYYSAKGCPAYHPRMMLKVWVYAYCQGVYTSRPLSKKLREDLGFLWLSGGQSPCFKTLSSFRSGALGAMIDKVLLEVLFYLQEQGFIDLDNLYTDGSKWEANANKYKIVWGKNTARYKAAVLARIEEFLAQVAILQQEEDQRYGKQDLSEHQNEAKIAFSLNSEELEECIKNVNELAHLASQKNEKRKLKSLGNKLSKEKVKLEKYEKQEDLLKGRNSYVKTDTDAQGLRMKDDQLKPGYNTQITSSGQFIIHSSIHQNASDSPTLIPHLKGLEKQVAPLLNEKWSPDLTTDAGYGSEENYAFLEGRGWNAYVKYPSWYREVKGKLAEKTYWSGNWTYQQEEDYYQCPEGRKLTFLEERKRITNNGYETLLSIYECESCKDCPVFKACRGEKTSENTNRKVQRNLKIQAYKVKARELLASPTGKEKRSQRSVDVETPFADMKHNMKHRRFLLRGLKKVDIEFKLLVLAHNIRKIDCKQTGIWQNYYAQRAAKRQEKMKKRA